MDLENIPQSKFYIGQIVWAKVIGYPWWPAKVSITFANPR